MIHFDHVLLAVPDLDVAAEVTRSTYGWGTFAGGRHPGGTHNRVVPLGGQEYLELIAVSDESMRGGASVAAFLADGPGWFGWAVRDDDLDTTAARLGLKIREGSIETADGRKGAWRFAGTEQADASGGALPFFIDYGADRTDVWATRYDEAQHREPPAGIAWVEVGGEEERVRQWLGGAVLDVRVTTGASRLAAVGFNLADGRSIEVRDWPG